MKLIPLKVAYQPRSIDQFFISLKKGITLIINQSSLPREHFPVLFQLGFIYSPVVVVIDTQLDDIDYCAYTITTQDNILNLQWTYEAITRFEENWILTGAILTSPQPSKLKQATVIETLSGAVNPVEVKLI